MTINVFLASSLLDLELDQHRQAEAVGGRTFRTGIASLDKDFPESFWRGGDVVAVGADGAGGKKASSVSVELVVTHLLDQHRTTDTTSMTDAIPSVFIIAPPSLASTTIQTIYRLLETRLRQAPAKAPTPAPAMTPTATIKSHLSQISLLQYLDISGLSESISEVLETLTSSPQRPDHTHGRGKSICLIQGLPMTITSTHRRVGTLQTAALSSSIMQGLRNLARRSTSTSSGGCLVLIESEIIWDGGVNGPTSTDNPAITATATSAMTSTTMTTTTTTLRSSFSSRTGKHLRSNMNPVYARIIEDGVDVFVAVHDAEGRTRRADDKEKKRERVVECVRDERGFVKWDHVGVDDGVDQGGSGGSVGVNSLGCWAVWG